MEKSGWWVYAMISTKSHIIYVGMSEQVEQRVKVHNNGKVKSTKGHTPWECFFQEYIGDRVRAREVEKYYKSGVGKRKLKKMLE